MKTFADVFRSSRIVNSHICVLQPEFGASRHTLLWID
jgi:hypothetical protein